MLTPLPPIERLPLRGSELGFGFTAQEAFPAEIDTEAQFTPELAAAAEQSAGLGVTAIIPDDPTDPTLKLDGFNAYEQGRPDSVIAIVWPAIVRDPLRAIELVLPAIVQFTAFPATETEAQVTFELAVGALQPLAAEAVIVPEPPVATTLRLFAVKLYGQIPVCSLKTKPS